MFVVEKLHMISCILLFLLFPCNIKQFAKAADFIYAGCSPAKYDPITPFQTNLDSLLTSIVTGAALSSYNNYSAGDTALLPPGLAVYGLFQCRPDLSIPDCAACVKAAVSQLDQVCPQSFAASLQLGGCFVRYSNEDFVGRPDTATVYQKCSDSTSDDGRFVQQREDVLAGLQSAACYRVSVSGTVQGDVQCLGDLSVADCAACLSQAVAQLRGACGSAISADVYLAQCYARYWAPDHYFRAAVEEGDLCFNCRAGLHVFAVNR
ncbi:cysteine-rich repeat secretory protein 15-like isoform X1 [Canna indica]|uniref:Cysteine-rich repeat secretory protein 15-like isoform X1 n=1 Tax=Canna indica TaxID=4628 RepID=A0AAQ3KCV7_9LILI|nr:cysteine-rich repeat secretory protein 15-like isoform X1 [Canna indica]